jgi:hypothetical protein
MASAAFATRGFEEKNCQGDELPFSFSTSMRRCSPECERRMEWKSIRQKKRKLKRHTTGQADERAVEMGKIDGNDAMRFRFWKALG